jgi:SAM-dependent methyltransferase
MPIDHCRIISLSMVKNEQDIIEPFIRHNSRYVDFMIIMDNASVDLTRPIAVDCARELKSIIIADSEEFAYNQAERMTRLLHYCQSAFFADFVLLLDADEFISSPDRQALERSLRAIPRDGVGSIPWRTFVMTPNETGRQTEDPPRSLHFRRAMELPQYGKAVLRLDGAYRPDLHINQGNHSVRAASGAPLPLTWLKDIQLMHFPVRSREQLAGKSVVGWMAYLARNPGARRDILGTQWRDAFDRVAATGASGLSDNDLCEMSLHYAQSRSATDWQKDAVEEKPPCDYARRYSTGKFADPIALIARSWERSLSPPAPPLQFNRPSTRNAGAEVAKMPFSAAWHWDNFFLDIPPFRYIAEKYAPSTVLDIGCGIGAALQLFKHLGAKAVFGIDGLRDDLTLLQGGEYARRDLSRPLNLDRVFDCALCLELAARLPAQSAKVLIETIAAHSGGTIIFSAAGPGQPGYGHINCRPLSYWLTLWSERGWGPDLADTLSMRCLSTLSWFRRNLVVLRPGISAETSAATVILGEISARPFQWYNQSPGIRSTAFVEPLPPPPAGYATQTTAQKSS